MSHAYSNFRTKPGFYSRSEVARERMGDPALASFNRCMGFCLERFNRGKETMVMEVVALDRVRGRFGVSFYLECRPDLIVEGRLDGDLLTVEGLCYDAGTRQDFLTLLPRISRTLMEMEYDASVPRF